MSGAASRHKLEVGDKGNEMGKGFKTPCHNSIVLSLYIILCQDSEDFSVRNFASHWLNLADYAEVQPKNARVVT